MDRTLRDHIASLEKRLKELEREATLGSRTPGEREHVNNAIRAAQLALAHYRKALELEKEVAAC